jgi:hypothetical protein
MMATLEQRCFIHTDLATAFHVSQDYACRSQWDPFVRTIHREANGHVSITAWHGMQMRVEYVSWQPPERAAIRMVNGPRMLENFAGSWRFIQLAPGLVEARFRYQIKAAHNWRFLESWLSRYFNLETKRRLTAFKFYLEQPDKKPVQNTAQT